MRDKLNDGNFVDDGDSWSGLNQVKKQVREVNPCDWTKPTNWFSKKRSDEGWLLILRRKDISWTWIWRN